MTDDVDTLSGFVMTFLKLLKKLPSTLDTGVELVPLTDDFIFYSCRDILNLVVGLRVFYY